MQIAGSLGISADFITASSPNADAFAAEQQRRHRIAPTRRRPELR